MTFRIDKDMHGTPTVSVRHDGRCWRAGPITTTGQAATPADAAQALTQRLTDTLATFWDPPAKGKAPEGVDMVTLARIRALDREMATLQGTMGRNQTRLAAIDQDRSHAIAQAADEASLVAGLARLDAERSQLGLTQTQIQDAIRLKAAQRAELLTRWRIDRHQVVSVTIDREAAKATAAKAAAWKALEEAIAPHLAAIAEAEGRLQALTGDAVSNAVQGKLEEQLLTVVPPAPAAVQTPTAKPHQLAAAAS